MTCCTEKKNVHQAIRCIFVSGINIALPKAFLGGLTRKPMLDACVKCGRRLRRKAPCVEHEKSMCRKCCELYHETCQYKMFCWYGLV